MSGNAVNLVNLVVGDSSMRYLCRMPLRATSMLQITIRLLPVLVAGGCTHTAPREVSFQALAGKPGDTVEIQQRCETTVFLATSPSGIGTAKITLCQGEWPADVRVRLRYADGRPFPKVEGFTCAPVGHQVVEVRDITYLPDYAEVRLPTEVLRSTDHSMVVQWVDYYR